MYTYKKLEKVDPKNPYAPEFHGTFELSIPISSVSHRSSRSRRTLLPKNSDKNAPKKYAEIGSSRYSARFHSPLPSAMANSTTFAVCALQNTPPRRMNV